MGSSKKHASDKSRDAKRKRHRRHSRSVSPDRERSEKDSRDRSSSHRHHKKHKKYHRKEYDSDVEIVSAPPPPKISKSSQHPTTPSLPAISSKEDKHGKGQGIDRAKDDKYSYYHSGASQSSSHTQDKHSNRNSRKSSSSGKVGSGQYQQSLSVEKTNKLRAKLGLKPLEVESTNKEDSDVIKDDLGEFRHKPAINTAEKEKMQKLKEKISTFREKRQIESALAATKTLGESDSDDDVSEWVKKSRKLEEEKKKAADRAKILDQMDEEFGIENIVKEEIRSEKANAYTSKDLTGLKVEHSLDNFEDGSAVILTLKDKAILEEEDDVLVNVNMVDNERYKKNILIRSKTPGYDAFEDNLDEYGVSVNKVLEKYDEEIEGEKRDSFAIGLVDPKELKERKTEIMKNRFANRRLESLQMSEPKIASEYYNEEELVKFKKPKKKVRKIRNKLKVDDLISDSNDYLGDLGSSRRRRTDNADGAANDVLDVDDLEPPKEDLSGLKIEFEDEDVDRRIIQRAQKLRSQSIRIKSENLGLDLVKKEPEQEDVDMVTSENIVLSSTAEFCRTLGDIPTYGQAGNREENNGEYMDFDTSKLKQEAVEEDDHANERGAWNTVEVEERSKEPSAMEATILDTEPSLGQGVSGALRLAMSKGYLQKEDTNRPSASRFAHLKAQNYSIEDKTYGDDDKFGRRDRFNGPTMDFKEKESFRPNVKLEYIDDDGRILNAKEAFKYLSHKFHGIGPRKNKVDKRMKKAEREILMKRMSSTDTPLGTLYLLQAMQKEMQSPFIILSGSKHMQTRIFKTKN